MTNGTRKPTGHYEGSRITGRYWVGGCTCGSGIEGRELYDGRGIYCGITVHRAGGRTSTGPKS